MLCPMRNVLDFHPFMSILTVSWMCDSCIHSYIKGDWGRSSTFVLGLSIFIIFDLTTDVFAQSVVFENLHFFIIN